MPNLSPRRLIAAVLALLAAVAVTITVTGTLDEGGGHGTITIHVGPTSAPVVLTPEAQDQVDALKARAQTTPVRTHVDLRSEAGLTPATRAANDAQRPLGQAAVPKYPAQAAPSIPGCRTKLVRNYSSRNGAPVLLGVVHLTDSPPSDGWEGVNANTSWFDAAAASASSNVIMSRAGLCNLVVPEYRKAWTQAAFNPWSLSVEVTTNEQPQTFMTPTGDRALVRLLYGWHVRWHLPIRRGLVTQNGCRVVRSGYLDHRSLGVCGGNHGDIAPYSITAIISRLRAYARSRAPQPVAAVYARLCRELNAFRRDRARGRDARTGRPVTRHRLDVNIQRRERLERHHIRCTTAGAVRA